ncbi:MAG TPA: hypothetical protein VN999_01290 [Thermoanaerobaculia bacterium]|nr:hypothetical protein [Thermoanaerobaculia bacterium]
MPRRDEKSEDRGRSEIRGRLVGVLQWRKQVVELLAEGPAAGGGVFEAMEDEQAHPDAESVGPDLVAISLVAEDALRDQLIQRGPGLVGDLPQAFVDVGATQDLTLEIAAGQVLQETLVCILAPVGGSAWLRPADLVGGVEPIQHLFAEGGVVVDPGAMLGGQPQESRASEELLDGGRPAVEPIARQALERQGTLQLGVIVGLDAQRPEVTTGQALHSRRDLFPRLTPDAAEARAGAAIRVGMR